MTIGAVMAVIGVALAVIHAPLWLIGIAEVIAYLIWAYHHPYIACWNCGGTGNSKMSTARRKGNCMRCKGKGKLTTLGYRVMRSVVGRAHGKKGK